MVPQQAHYQFRWLKCVRAHLGLSICYLLSAICYSLQTVGTSSSSSALVRPQPGAPISLGRAGSRAYRLLRSHLARSAMGFRLLLKTLLPFPALTALPAIPYD
jgi:hypothetical protein